MEGRSGVRGIEAADRNTAGAELVGYIFGRFDECFKTGE